LLTYADFWLRSVVGERDKWSGERREAFSESQPERNATAEPQTEGRRSFGPALCKLVTSARFEKRNGRRREGDRGDGQTVKRSKSRVGNGGSQQSAVSQFVGTRVR
jgi:hypothetical protein